jgi:hypothetical protein
LGVEGNVGDFAILDHLQFFGVVVEDLDLLLKLVDSLQTHLSEVEAFIRCIEESFGSILKEVSDLLTEILLVLH